MNNNACLLYHQSDTKNSENVIFTEPFEMTELHIDL